MTIKELARQLGVSTATVSRALSQPELVASETRSRVLAAAKACGYQPDAIARSLRTGRTQSIGLIVSDITNPFYATVVRAIENVARPRGYSVIICNADENPQREEEALALLASKQVAGIIHASTGANLAALEALRARGIPLVDLDRASGLSGVDAVLVDNALGARLAVGHLISLGHRRIATIAGPQSLTTGRERLDGFLAAMRSAGLPVPPEFVHTCDFQAESAELAAAEMLSLPHPPSALFVANNAMMAGAFAAIRERGVRVPEDLSTVSFDDVQWAKYIEPPLTVIAQPAEIIGAMAAELVFRRIGGEKRPLRRVLDPVLIVRGSTAAPARAQKPAPLRPAPVTNPLG